MAAVAQRQLTGENGPFYALLARSDGRSACSSLCPLFSLVGAPVARAERAEPPQKTHRCHGHRSGRRSRRKASIPLGGVLVSLRNDTGDVASVGPTETASSGFDAITPGRYSVVTTMQGFDTLTSTVVVTAGQTASWRWISASRR